MTRSVRGMRRRRLSAAARLARLAAEAERMERDLVRLARAEARGLGAQAQPALTRLETALGAAGAAARRLAAGSADESRTASEACADRDWRGVASGGETLRDADETKSPGEDPGNWSEH